MKKLIFGVNPVLEALRSSDSGVSHLTLSNDRTINKEIQQILFYAKQKNIEVLRKKKRELDLICGSMSHQGILAEIFEKKILDFDSLVEDVLRREKFATLVVLDEVQDPHNLGSIIRSAECLGVHGIIIPKHRAAGITSVVTKTSAGATHYVSVVQVVNVADTLEKLKENNFNILGIDQEGAKEIWDFEYKWPLALVVGGEGKGIRPLVKRKCDALLKIPMQGKISSLNVSVASALLFYEVLKNKSSLNLSKSF